MNEQATAKKMESALTAFIRRETMVGPESCARFLRNSGAVGALMRVTKENEIPTFNGPELSVFAEPKLGAIAGKCIAYIEAGHSGKHIFALGLPKVEVDDYDDYGQEPVGYYALGQRFTGVVLE